MSRYLELSRIQHVFHTYTPENVYVNMFFLHSQYSYML